jgi:uncharacterized protein (DUF488 family)
MSTCIYTIGHSAQSADAFVDRLTTAAVDFVIDVRRFPHSRRHPQFNGEALAAVLARHAIEYRHLEALGGRRGRRLSDDASPNAGWREPGFRHYADYALTPPFRTALQAVLDLATNATPAIMCAEALWWRCHRRILSDYLLVSGADVRHIVGDAVKAATLTPGAEPQPDGSIHYPLRGEPLL